MRVDVYNAIQGQVIGTGDWKPGGASGPPGHDKPWPGFLLDGTPVLYKRYQREVQGEKWYYIGFPPKNGWTDASGNEQSSVFLKEL